LSNLSVVAGGAIRLEANPDLPRALHKGLVLRAGTTVTAEGDHGFVQCQDEAVTDPLLPPLRVIAHAMPDLSEILPTLKVPQPAPDMPGERTARRKMKGALRPNS
jgi:hypothetical protein